MINLHAIKCWRDFYRAIEAGDKKHELRKNDRNYQIDDILHLQEYDEITSTYTGQSMLVQVTYISRNVSSWGLAEGFVIMSIAKLERKR